MSRADSPSAKARKVAREGVLADLEYLDRVIADGMLDAADARAVLLTMHARLLAVGGKLGDVPTALRELLGDRGNRLLQPPKLAELIARLVFDRRPALLVDPWSVDPFVEAVKAIASDHNLEKGAVLDGHRWNGWVEIDGFGRVDRARSLIDAGREVHAELQGSDVARWLRRVP